MNDHKTAIKTRNKKLSISSKMTGELNCSDFFKNSFVSLRQFKMLKWYKMSVSALARSWIFPQKS